VRRSFCAICAFPPWRKYRINCDTIRNVGHHRPIYAKKNLPRKGGRFAERDESLVTRGYTRYTWYTSGTISSRSAVSRRLNRQLIAGLSPAKQELINSRNAQAATERIAFYFYSLSLTFSRNIADVGNLDCVQINFLLLDMQASTRVPAARW